MQPQSWALPSTLHPCACREVLLRSCNTFAIAASKTDHKGSLSAKVNISNPGRFRVKAGLPSALAAVLRSSSKFLHVQPVLSQQPESLHQYLIGIWKSHCTPFTAGLTSRHNLGYLLCKRTALARLLPPVLVRQNLAGSLWILDSC